MRRLAMLGLLGAVSISPAVAAQLDEPNTCSYTATILAAADFLLTEPAKFPNFWRDRVGDDAAYLKIRYGDLNYAESSELLASLEKRSHPPLRIVELRLAYATKSDRAAMIAGMQLPRNTKSIVPQLGESALRALIVEDGGDWLLSELARWQTSDPYSASVATAEIAQSLADLSDDAKSRLAKRAEDAGVATLALHLLALKDNLADYLSYLHKIPMAPGATALPPDKDWRDRSMREALYEEDFRPSFDMSVQPTEVQAMDRKIGWGPVWRPIGQLVNYSPVAEILMTSMRDSGDRRVGTVVAAGLDRQISAKQVNPISNPDALIASMVLGLDYIFGRTAREHILVLFGVSEMQGETAEEFVDRVWARLTLAPFVEGKVAKPPSRPVQLAAVFPWEQWVRLAGQLRAGEAISPDDSIVAADLLSAAGRPADALTLLTTARDWKTAVLRTHALARGLDRRCADVLGRSKPFSEPLYRFEPR